MGLVTYRTLLIAIFVTILNNETYQLETTPGTIIIDIHKSTLVKVHSIESLKHLYIKLHCRLKH